MNRHFARNDWIALISLGLVLIEGIAIRVQIFSEPRALWLDEAVVANLVSSKSRLGDFLALDFSSAHGRPIGYLLLTKILTLNGGKSEHSVRVLSLIASCLTLPAGALLIWKLFRSWPLVVLGTLSLALAGEHVARAAEFKPYSFERYNRIWCTAMS